MKRAALTLLIAGALYPAAGAQQPASAPVTFSKDVAPILQKACQNCHRPGAIAPMSLLTYQDARPWARSIKAKVTAREMPPWYVDRHIGITKFKDDPSLTESEIATIVNWVVSPPLIVGVNGPLVTVPVLVTVNVFVELPEFTTTLP